MAAGVFGRDAGYTVLPRWALAAAGLFSRPVREIRELLPRYGQDNLFDSSKFKRRFPAFAVTTYREGLARIQQEGAGFSLVPWQQVIEQWLLGQQIAATVRGAGAGAACGIGRARGSSIG